MARDPVDPGDDVGRRSGAAAAEHADGHEHDVLRNAVARPPDRPGDVRTVTVAVIGAPPVADCGEACSNTPAPVRELTVGPPDAGVDDERRDSDAVADGGERV